MESATAMGDGQRLSVPRFDQLPPRPLLSEQVAATVLEAIFAQGLKPGDPLPSERELGEQFGVSRTVVREALRALAAKGVLDVRAGRSPRVASVAADSVTESMTLFLRSGGLEYPLVHDVRTMLETQIAYRAAEQASDEDIDELRRLCSEMARSGSDRDAASQHDVEFHRALARSTHNQLYLVLLDSIGQPLLDIRRKLIGGRLRPTVAAHRKILTAIATRDPAAAHQAMREHLETVAEAWREGASQLDAVRRT